MAAGRRRSKKPEVKPTAEQFIPLDPGASLDTYRIDRLLSKDPAFKDVEAVELRLKQRQYRLVVNRAANLADKYPTEEDLEGIARTKQTLKLLPNISKLSKNAVRNLMNGSGFLEQTRAPLSEKLWATSKAIDDFLTRIRWPNCLLRAVFGTLLPISFFGF
jgi:hypothetical protein